MNMRTKQQMREETKGKELTNLNVEFCLHGVSFPYACRKLTKYPQLFMSPNCSLPWFLLAVSENSVLEPNNLLFFISAENYKGKNCKR